MKRSNTAYYIKIGVLLLMIAGIIASITWTVIWANKPSVTTISVPRSTAPTTSDQQPLTTTYYSTLIPAGYNVKNNTDPSKPGTTQILAYGSGVSRTDIGFTSAPLPSDGIYGVADYNMRRQEASGYTLVPPDGFGGAEYVFRKTGAQPEMTAFVVHNNRYLTISLTGGTESLQAEQLQRILTALTWST